MFNAPTRLVLSDRLLHSESAWVSVASVDARGGGRIKFRASHLNRRVLFRPGKTMLKINSQLGRSLRYQSAVGSERLVGHFDDGARDLAGPSTRQYREVRASDRSRRTGARQMLVRRDPVTGSYVGYYSDEQA